MGDIQVLIDATNWAKENPDRHDQSERDYCIIGHYMYTHVGDDWIIIDLEFAERAGITENEAETLYREFNDDNAGAIAYAESLIQKYGGNVNYIKPGAIRLTVNGKPEQDFEDESEARAVARYLKNRGDDVKLTKMVEVEI